MRKMNLIIEKMFDDAQIPSKEHPRSSGFDLYAHRFIKHYKANPLWYGQEKCFEVPADIKTLDLHRNERVMIGTGIKARVDYAKMDMQSFCSLHDLTWELQVRARSGTALKRGLIVTNGVGTVDDGYTGEICVIITNTSTGIQTIEVGERIAQLVPCLVSLPNIVISEVGKSSDGRGDGGFNSTGTR